MMKSNNLFTTLFLLTIILVASERCIAKRIGGDIDGSSFAKTIGKESSKSNGEHHRELQSFLFEIPNNFLFYVYALCFSSHTTAEVKGRGQVPMSDIQVGDEVLTAKGKYETIYAMAHRHPTKSANFIQLFTNDEHSQPPLELSEKHMLYLEGNRNPVPANIVQLGDSVQTLHGPREVTKISLVTRKGIYNPLTTDGTIVASGIISSVYSALLSNDEWIKMGGYKIMTHQDFFNKALKPYRYLCTGVSLELCKTTDERIAIVQLAANFADYWLEQSKIFQVISASFLISVVYFFDLILQPSTLILGLMIVSLIGWFTLTKKKNQVTKCKHKIA